MTGGQGLGVDASVSANILETASFNKTNQETSAASQGKSQVLPTSEVPLLAMNRMPALAASNIPLHTTGAATPESPPDLGAAVTVHPPDSRFKQREEAGWARVLNGVSHIADFGAFLMNARIPVSPELLKYIPFSDGVKKNGIYSVNDVLDGCKQLLRIALVPVSMWADASAPNSKLRTDYSGILGILQPRYSTIGEDGKPTTVSTREAYELRKQERRSARHARTNGGDIDKKKDLELDAA
jgi:hypothetical protein